MRGEETTRPDNEPIATVDRRALLAGLAGVTCGCVNPGGREAPESTQSERDPSTGTATGMSTGPTRTNGQNPAVLAGSLPLSGSLSAIGVSLHRGLRSWATRVNNRGGLQGRPVNLRIEDDGGDPEAAPDIYRSLVDQADLLVAPYGSPGTRAVLDVVESAGLPCVAHTAGDRALWADGRDWTVQLLNPIDTFLHSALAATAKKGARSVALIYREDEFTSTVMQGAVDRARTQGWRVTSEVTYTPTDGLMEKMQTVTESDPDLLAGGGFQPGRAGGGFLPDSLALSRAYEQVDDDASFVNWGIGASFPAFRERHGVPADGATGVTGWKAYIGFPGNRGFIDRYTDRWDAPADAHAAQGFASGQVIESAIERAGAIEPVGVRNALFELRTATVFGRYQVDDRGLQIGKENTVVQWQDGAPVVVWPVRWRDGELVSGG